MCWTMTGIGCNKKWTPLLFFTRNFQQLNHTTISIMHNTFPRIWWTLKTISASHCRPLLFKAVGPSEMVSSGVIAEDMLFRWDLVWGMPTPFADTFNPILIQYNKDRFDIVGNYVWPRWGLTERPYATTTIVFFMMCDSIWLSLS